MESLDLRVEGRADALLAISLAIMRWSVRIKGTHHLMMITIIPGAPSMIEGMTGTMGKGKGMQVIKEMADSSKKARNSRYE